MSCKDNRFPGSIFKVSIVLAILFFAASGSAYLDGFEDNDLSEWQVDAMQIVSDYTLNGSYAGYSNNGQFGVNDYQARFNVSSDNTNITFFEFYYRETSSGSYGGGLRLFDKAGNEVMGLASDNPQWMRTDGNEEYQIYSGDGYERWVRVNATFNWSDGTYDTGWKDLESGNSTIATDIPLASTAGVQEIWYQSFTTSTGSDYGWSYGSTHEMWLDNITYLETPLSAESVIGDYTGNNWDISGTQDKDTYNSLHFFDGNFYISDNSWGSDQQVDKLDTDFNSVDSWSFSQQRINGITSKGDYLYIGNRYDTEVLKTDTSGNVQNTIQVPEVGQDDMTGLAWNGTNFFAVDDGNTANRDYPIVYMYDSNWNYVGKSWNLDSNIGYNDGYFEFHDGSFFMAEDGVIRRYDKNFDLVEKKDISSETTGAKAITIRKDKIYVRTGQSPKIIHEYNYTNSSTTEENALPNINTLSPKSTNIKPSEAVLEVEALEPESEDMNISFYDSSDHSQIDKIENVGNGTYTATWTGLSEDQTYNWYANVTDGSSTNRSNTASFTTIDVTLNWNDNSNNEDGFNIYSNASGSLQKVGEASADTESKTIYNSGLEFGKNTTYKVAAYNQYGESDRITGYVKP